MKSNFTQGIVCQLNAIVTAIEQHFPGIEGRHKDLWITTPFSINESCIRDDNMGAKIKFLGLREGSSLIIDFATTDIENFWPGIQHEYPFF